MISRRLEQLKMTTSLSDFAELLGFRPNAVSYILYKIPAKGKYTEFQISKTNGKKRTIKAPIEKLKHLQRRLADLLNESFELISKDKRPLSHGFRKRHSIITNAKKHKNKRYVFNIDLKDFFPSINFGRVRGYFIHNHNFKLNPKVATVIAQIACHDNELPQGSPCSPIISNLIGHLLDIRMAQLAKRTKCTYSRYADDLTFSTNKKDFSEKIAKLNDDNKWTAGQKLIKEIKKTGFIVNQEKTSMQFKTSRQTTTGLIVNKKVNVKREYYKKARAMCHALFKTGNFYINESVLPLKEAMEDSEQEEQQECSLNQLEGILNFIYQIKHFDYIALMKKNKKSIKVTPRLKKLEKELKEENDLSSITKLFKDFLFYKLFFAMEMPLIVTEGKTDPIYLKCALKQLASEYTELVEINEEGTNFRIKLLNLSKNIEKFLPILQGSNGLEQLINNYEKNISRFKGVGKSFPAIIILDNDEGAKKIRGILKIKATARIKPFYHFTENLYVLIVPKDRKGAIENLFDEETLNSKVDGKCFNCSNKKADKKKEYGKYDFAKKVIQPNQEKINFDGFKEIFDGIKLIIGDYQKRKDAIKKSKSVSEKVCKWL